MANTIKSYETKTKPPKRCIYRRALKDNTLKYNSYQPTQVYLSKGYKGHSLKIEFLRKYVHLFDSKHQKLKPQPTMECRGTTVPSVPKQQKWPSGKQSSTPHWCTSDKASSTLQDTHITVIMHSLLWMYGSKCTLLHMKEHLKAPIASQGSVLQSCGKWPDGNHGLKWI